ncbi:influenza virus NS1A-binding protein homolog A [Lingula anatina]|uniref:Influenza virus NS1A-binding protein homolog A n=1 Tax=Lingula anatina TaxID=7574 RepID=A0A1S3HQ85_LINAN|nr:influenza virus NS1A-binding protein homolog A [Lingula anatina]|eukprot:XP_013387701.1 influenza virus NS1A-binding protein homolog A [Lingula anatina]
MEEDGEIMEQDVMIFDDIQQKQTILNDLNILRKNAQFCDVILEVEGHEIPAHRAVLACASQYLFDLFQQEEGNHLTHCKLQGLDYEVFEYLVTYAYTARLEVAGDLVKSVYKTATMLKMQRAADACSCYLAEHLTPINCLGIRCCAISDDNLKQKVDNYIQQEITAITETCPEFIRLPRIQVDIIGASEHGLQSSNEKHLCQLVLDWLKDNVGQTNNLDAVTDYVNMLYLNNDNTLHDAKDLDDYSLNNAEIIQDYKKLAKKRHRSPKNSFSRILPSENTNTTYPMKSRKHSGGRFSPQLIADEWKVIASLKNGEQSIMCIAILDSTVVSMSLHLLSRDNVTPVATNGEVSPTHSPKGSIFENSKSLTMLAPMSSPRCGVGTAVLDGKIIALGGYDRGECLRTAEMYDMSTNSWTALPSMGTPRGRFDVSQIQGRLYACGGSNGHTELKSAECYDPESEKWTPVADMLKCKSSAGVAVLNDKLYVIGGWSGLQGVKSCEVFDPETNKWSTIAKLNVGRSQAAVCAMNGKLYAVGGCDSWHCLNSVEVYSPEENKWTMVAPLSMPRRGAGTTVFNGKLCVVGGSDGCSPSLATMEVFDPATNSWAFGPPMNVCRANVGVAVCDNKLYAVGGFSGSTFLDSIEYLDGDTNEWSSYLPMKEAAMVNGTFEKLDSCAGDAEKSVS